MTIESLLKTASIKLAVCSDSPKLDAKLLLASALEKDTTYLFTWADKTVLPEQELAFEQLLDRRLNGEPIAYILGTKEFWSLPFYVSPATLIPRPDTETLIELVLNDWQQSQLNLLDLGTGTGAIALALASEQTSWQITAVDYSQDAVELAQKNARNLQLEQVNIKQSDWYKSIEQQSLFDVIVSNPPYIDEQDPHLEQGDVRFEPKSALVADNEGLADLSLIIEQGKSFLKANGKMYLEHGYQQGKQVRALFEKFGYQNATTVKDLSGNDRITWALFGG